MFGDIYGFNIGEQGMAFLGKRNVPIKQPVSPTNALLFLLYVHESGFVPAAVITFAFYVYHLKHRIEPLQRAGTMIVEDRLEIGLIASVFVPISMFAFGWTSRSSIHWIVPVISASLYFPGIWLMFQSVLVYLAESYYPNNAAAIGGNTLVRCFVGGAFPLFGRIYFDKLGVGVGSSVLGAISIVLSGGLWLIKRYGKGFRERSRYIVVVKDTKEEEVREA